MRDLFILSYRSFYYALGFIIIGVLLFFNIIIDKIYNNKIGIKN
jgi:hypothetical protein